MAAQDKQLKVFFIGRNADGEFGIGNISPQKELIESNLSITKIHPSDKYTFYADHNYQNIWFAGSNYKDQSGIKSISGNYKISELESYLF